MLEQGSELIRAHQLVGAIESFSRIMLRQKQSEFEIVEWVGFVLQGQVV